MSATEKLTVQIEDLQHAKTILSRGGRFEVFVDHALLQLPEDMAASLQVHVQKAVHDRLEVLRKLVPRWVVNVCVTGRGYRGDTPWVTVGEAPDEAGALAIARDAFSQFMQAMGYRSDGAGSLWAKGDDLVEPFPAGKSGDRWGASRTIRDLDLLYGIVVQEEVPA